MSSLLAWLVVLGIALSLKARSRTADEVPTGFYNFFEWVIEGAYGFAENIAGSKVKDFFPFFMTFVLFILVTNWMGLIPFWDSLGFWEHKPHFEVLAAEKEAEATGNHLTEEEILVLEEAIDEENVGDLRVDGLIFNSSLLVRKTNANEGADIVQDDKGRKVGYNPDAADWTLVPVFRPGATDLNFTLAFAIIAMVMVQYYGVKYLGARGYFAKFFPFIG
ncbi:MAG: F0F1 ATP synthase subunit A, partial [Ardenticatenaceae bacterium]|nr:F0F1 ATP synthase subunit A [Ardenticatenaceae bacterium]